MKTEITLDEIRADIVRAYPRIANESGMIRVSQIEAEAPELLKKIYSRYGQSKDSFQVMVVKMRKDGLIPKIGAKVNRSSLVLAQRKLAVVKVENPDHDRGERRKQMMLEAHTIAGLRQKIKWAVLKRENPSLLQQLLAEYGGELPHLRAAAARYRKSGLFKKSATPHTNGRAEQAHVNGDVKPVPPAAPGYAINRCPNCGMNMEGLSKAMLILSKLGPEKINAVLAGLQNLEE